MVTFPGGPLWISYIGITWEACKNLCSQSTPLSVESGGLNGDESSGGLRPGHGKGESLPCSALSVLNLTSSYQEWKPEAKKMPVLASHTHPAVPTHTEAEGILVGAARPIMYHALHGHHLPCLLGLAVQVASLLGWKRKWQGISVELSCKRSTTGGRKFYKCSSNSLVPKQPVLQSRHRGKEAGDGNLCPTSLSSEPLTLVLLGLERTFPTGFTSLWPAPRS